MSNKIYILLHLSTPTYEMTETLFRPGINMLQSDSITSGCILIYRCKHTKGPLGKTSRTNPQKHIWRWSGQHFIHCLAMYKMCSNPHWRTTYITNVFCAGKKETHTHNSVTLNHQTTSISHNWQLHTNTHRHKLEGCFSFFLVLKRGLVHFYLQQS